MSDLVGGLRDHGLDAAGAQQRTVPSGGVRLVAEHRIRGGPGTSWSTAVDAQVREENREHRRVIRLSRTDQHDQGSTATVDELVDLRRQPTAGASDAVMDRLVVGAEDALRCALTCRNRWILVIRSSPLCRR